VKAAQQKEKADEKEERKHLIDQWRKDKVKWEKDLAVHQSCGGLVKTFWAAPKHPTWGKRRPQQSIAFSYISDALGDEEEAAQSKCDDSEGGSEGK